MTREEAIHYGKDYLKDLTTACCHIEDKHKDFVRMAIKALEQTTWIPVSERLPNHDECIKNNGLFNVSDGDRSYSERFDFYGKQRFGELTMYGFRVDRAVTAWMPLPESYKAESEPQESEDKE